MNLSLAAAIVLLAIPVAAQEHSHVHNPPGASSAAQESPEARHHAFLADERAAIERGEGFGMAMAADHNGYPGPRHVLQLKSELHLSPEQEAAMEKLFAQMHEQAVASGKEVLAAEAKLEEMFTETRPENEIHAQIDRIAALRAELRWVHLAAHLAARKLLTPEQLAAYQQLRHGPTGASGGFGASQ